jgi:hypothetical protein
MELNDTLNIVKAGELYYLYIDGKKVGVYGNPAKAMEEAMLELGYTIGEEPYE